MIEILDKSKCVGCAACVNACAKKAISFNVDNEGFCYPTVDKSLCVNCGLCDSVCPVKNVDSAKKGALPKPITYAAQHKQESVRIASTSGGLVSALAEAAYAENGAFGGVVFTEDFLAEYLVSANPDDLEKIRTSKYFQADSTKMFSQIKDLIAKEKTVVVCGTPCQMAALKLYFKKDLDKLILVEVICAGINSPKAFKAHLNTLEKKYGSKVKAFRAKSKENGWRSLACKIEFENGQTYFANGPDDDFTRGFIGAHAFMRPSCFECQYKGFPRASDITIGDFWGIEKIPNKLDDNKGTSVAIINTEKGRDFFEKVKEFVDYEEHSLCDAVVNNRAILKGYLIPDINRTFMFKMMDSEPFDMVAKEFFPKQKKTIVIVRMIKKLFGVWNKIPHSPQVLWQTIWINFLRKNTFRKCRRKLPFVSDKYNALDVHESAKIILNGQLKFGYKRNGKSRIESALLLERNSVFEVGDVNVYYGADFQVFENASLRIGKSTINKNVQIICMDSISIGNDCLISRDVVIRDNDGGHHVLTPGFRTTAPVVIGNRVWIGHGAMIMKGVTIGDGAIIGAGAWVATDVKPNAVVMGDPARTVQKNVDWVP